MSSRVPWEAGPPTEPYLEPVLSYYGENTAPVNPRFTRCHFKDIGRVRDSEHCKSQQRYRSIDPMPWDPKHFGIQMFLELRKVI